MKYPEESMERWIYNLPRYKVELKCKRILSVTYRFCKMNAGHIQLIFLICCITHLVQNDGSHFADHIHCDQAWPAHNPDINLCSF